MLLTKVSEPLQALLAVFVVKNEIMSTNSHADLEAAAHAIKYWLNGQGKVVGFQRRCCSLLVELAGPSIRQATSV